MTNIDALAHKIKSVRDLIELNALIKNYSKSEGASSIQFASIAVTPSAAENCKVISLHDLGAQLQGLDSVQDNMNAKVSKVAVKFRFLSTQTNFMVFPFLVILENGETIAASSGTETDPGTAIDSAITGKYLLSLGEPIHCRYHRDNGSAYYLAPDMLVDITQACQQYLAKLHKAELSEQTALGAELGMFVICQANNMQVEGGATIFVQYHFEEGKVFL